MFPPLVGQNCRYLHLKVIKDIKVKVSLYSIKIQKLVGTFRYQTIEQNIDLLHSRVEWSECPRQSVEFHYYSYQIAIITLALAELL